MAEIQKKEKKKPGPSTYTLSEKGNTLAFEDRTGVYLGIHKKSTD